MPDDTSQGKAARTRRDLVEAAIVCWAGDNGRSLGEVADAAGVGRTGRAPGIAVGIADRAEGIADGVAGGAGGGTGATCCHGTDRSGDPRRSVGTSRS